MAIECPILTPEGLVYNPLPAQEAFHASAALNKAYIGGFGSGKTLCGAIETLLLCTEVPDLRGEQFLICRYEYDALEDTTWKTFLEIIPEPIRRQCHITKRPLTCVLPNGLAVLGKNLKEHKQRAGYKLAGAWMDECNEEGVAEEMREAIRQPRGVPGGHGGEPLSAGDLPAADAGDLPGGLAGEVFRG
jgi:phage terminase large subunit